jgi:hypothetical protein
LVGNFSFPKRKKITHIGEIIRNEKKTFSCALPIALNADDDLRREREPKYVAP